MWIVTIKVLFPKYLEIRISYESCEWSVKYQDYNIFPGSKVRIACENGHFSFFCLQSHYCVERNGLAEEWLRNTAFLNFCQFTDVRPEVQDAVPNTCGCCGGSGCLFGTADWPDKFH